MESAAEQAASSQLLQGAAKLGLEDDEDGDNPEGENLIHQPSEGIEVQPGAERPSDNQQQNAFDERNGARSPDELHHFINQKADDEDVRRVFDRIDPRQRLEVVQDAPPCSRVPFGRVSPAFSCKNFSSGRPNSFLFFARIFVFPRMVENLAKKPPSGAGEVRQTHAFAGDFAGLSRLCAPPYRGKRSGTAAIGAGQAPTISFRALTPPVHPPAPLPAPGPAATPFAVRSQP